ncbi:hypothetical protein QKU48_gp0016 [Fadolivirus algeromassiliense]|jgi:hypothetical protein|uniref:VWFA domain-containing protein n=1 Tax=Fadolivirus FV1/VV64 TaxID=3070911 RepID=A0A7D3UUU4_9VIRU|nr:hypothetical protein QKU48_gp0016 [Fadolivirus algeromassiliense]QKF93474.1 hypothetical protein Fadolivirus_1_16 [Fadolivirus FV1/VV64]
MSTLTVNVYPTIEGYMCKLVVPDNETFKQSKGDCQTFVILDRSGSMGQNVGRIMNQYLPGVFENLGYQNQKVRVLMFDDKLLNYEGTWKDMMSSKVTAGGSTYMTKAVEELQKQLSTSSIPKARILALSDGDLHDQNETLNMASRLAANIKGKMNINAQAIRFFTSSSQPDTRGLASILQLNNVGSTRLLDIPYDLNSSAIVKQIVDLFKDDGLDRSIKLITKETVLMSTPWASSSNSCFLNVGENTFWFKELPTELTIEGTTIKLDLQMQKVNSNQFETLIGPKLEFFLNKMKVLKVVNTVEAQNEIAQMMSYFTQLQSWMDANNTDTVKLLENGSLRGRVEYFKNVLIKRKKSIFQVMAQVANDERVSKLNSAQQADYLRKVEVTKNTKALARRTLESDIDFTGVLRKEVRDMHQHLKELDNVVDESEYTSFYSQDTVLGGIKAVCSLVDEKMLDDMEATDILQMINIVGIAVNAQIGDYPDPMSWRVNKIFPGCFISMSDITMAYLGSGGNKLYPPGFEKTHGNEITAVIPVFNDHKIVNFMRKYCPSMLEYSASVGMRRLITGVNMTHGYTLAAGILKLVEDLDTNKSTLNVESFVRLVKNFDVFVGKYFDHVLPHIQDQNENLTFFIGNNGYSNMIHPLYRLMKENNTKFTARILRSIYSFESYQIMRRVTKKHGVDQRHTYIGELLTQFLGIDFNKYGTPLTPNFEPNPTPVHHDQYHLDQKLIDELTVDFKDTDYIVLLPVLLSAVNSADPINTIQKIPKMDEKMICSVLGVPYDLQTFKFYSLAQSLFYPEKPERVDDEKNVMKIVDLGNRDNAEKMVRDYIRTQYGNHYTSQLVKKTKQEKEIVVGMLVNSLTYCNTLNEFCDLFKNGFTHKNVTHAIQNDASLGYVDLRANLVNLNLNVPLRADKLYVLFTGTDYSNTMIWNNGNKLRIKISDFEEFFNKIGGTSQFEKLKEIYKKHPTHLYREKENRHGHSNEKPSYWALGWQTLEDMIKDISDAEWQDYKSEHSNCCGVNKLHF